MDKVGRGPVIRAMALTLIAGLSVSALGAYLQHHNNERYVRQTVATEAARIADAIGQRIELYQYGLRGARGVVLTSGEWGVTRSAFRNYSLSRDIDKEFPGARGFGFIRRVPVSEEERFLERARADNAPAFTIRQLTPHGADRYVIQYIEPIERNQQAVGLDIASESNRREAALAAMRTGQPTLTGPVTLVQAAEHPQQSFLFLLPIYRSAVTPANVTDREASLLGWSYAPLLLDEVLGGLQIDNAMTQLTLWDITAPDHKQQFYQSEYDGLSLAYTDEVGREIFGRRWSIVFSVHPAYVSALHLVSPRLVFAISCFISLLFSALSGILAINKQQKRQAETRVLALNTSLEHQIVQRTEELAYANRLLTGVLESASEMSIIATDSDGLITVFNVGSERMLGYQSDEVIGKMTPAPLHVGEEMAARSIELSAEYGVAIEGFRVFVHGPELQGSETREWTYVRKDGSRLSVSLTVTVIRDQLGCVTGYLGIASDITERRVAEKALAAARDQLLLAADVAELGVWSWTLADDSLAWNDRMYEIYAQPKALREGGLSYEHWRSRVHVDDVESVEAKLKAAAEERGVYDPVFRVVRPDKSVVYVQAGAQIERGPDGRPIRVTGINRDITVQLELEASLRRAKEQADAASAAKSFFLANMSHEIRTPMNAVLGMMQLVQKTDLDTRQRDYIDKASSAAKSLLELLNDILDYSKIEAGKLELDLHAFELEALMRDLAVVLSGNLAKEDVEVIFDMAPSLPTTLVGDGLRLKQVLINLAGNALKFTEHGYVEVSVTELSRSSDRIELRIAVTDTGIGIDVDQQTRIFEGFTQAEASTSRRYGGTGLGLVISQRLVGLMGGTLQLDSEPGRGSRFWFDIELHVSPQSVSLKSTYPVFNTPIRTLVVDDNRQAGEVMVRALEGLEWRADYVGTGRLAVQYVKEASERGEAYDVVFMDWRLPDLDGVSAAQLIRDNAIGSARPPVIIMVTAYGREVLSDRQNVPNAPFVDFLTKPVIPLQLAAAVQRALYGVPVAKRVAMIDRPQRLAGLRVLVVEDNALNRQIAAALLMSEGAQVHLAEGGLEGVAQVLSGEHNFDVVMMDIQMPDIDGLEATRRIRLDSRFRDLPILAMTANVSQVDREQCLAAGMNEHIGKPFDLEELVLTLMARRDRLSTRDRSGGVAEGESVA